MGTDPEDSPIEKQIHELLHDRNDTISVFETCTGGLISSLLTSVPGASQHFNQALIPYSYDSHRTRAGVSRETLDRHGAVSSATTRELAERARDLTDSQWGLAVSGIAGPSGGSTNKPVGTSFVGVAYAAEWGTNKSFSETDKQQFDGSREEIRKKIAGHALHFLSSQLQQ